MDPRPAPAAPPARHDGARVRTAVPAPRAGRPARALPERDPAYGHLSLSALREYRTALQAEEGKVSYWRRILQARLDVLRAGDPGTGALPGADLRPVLTDARVSSGRNAFVEVLPVDDIPPLPSLAELWDRCVSPSDAAATEALSRDLERAESELSSYRAALHRRLGAATAELIARYHEQPTLCLSALPQQPGRAAHGGAWS